VRGMPSRRRFEWAEGLPRVVGTSGAKRTVLDYMAPRWRLPRSSYQITAAASLPAGAGSGCSGFGRNVLVGRLFSAASGFSGFFSFSSTKPTATSCFGSMWKFSTRKPTRSSLRFSRLRPSFARNPIRLKLNRV
jgi:hypothetical protein